MSNRGSYKLTTARGPLCLFQRVHSSKPTQASLDCIVNTWKTRSPKLTTSLAYTFSPPEKDGLNLGNPKISGKLAGHLRKALRFQGFFVYVLGSGLIIGPLKHPMKDEGYNSHDGSMGRLYIYTHVYHKNQRNVGKYTIHGSYGIVATP